MFVNVPTFLTIHLIRFISMTASDSMNASLEKNNGKKLKAMLDHGRIQLGRSSDGRLQQHEDSHDRLGRSLQCGC